MDISDINKEVCCQEDVISMMAEALGKAALKDVIAFEDSVISENKNVVEDLNSNGLNHKLVNGMYCRALHIPKGCVLTGKVHIGSYIDICAYGDITVKSFLHDGSIETEERITGFNFLSGVPGRKRVGVAHEDTLWITIDLAKSNDIENCEAEITVSTIEKYQKTLEEEKCQQL